MSSAISKKCHFASLGIGVFTMWRKLTSCARPRRSNREPTPAKMVSTESAEKGNVEYVLGRDYLASARYELLRRRYDIPKLLSFTNN